jgi:uncharacterized membrane protein YphA (DoxX/SURF4 family)
MTRKPTLEPPAPQWTPATLIAFRFALVYLGLFCLATQISGSMLPNLTVSYRGLGKLWPMRDVTHWVGTTVFGITSPLDDTSGGEPLFFWVQTFWVLVVSLAAAAIWTAMDRGRRHYATLHAWFYLFARVALAASLFEYGMTKVIPTQFPAPPLATLVTPVGDLTLSALLWTSIGSAQPYVVFTGCIEVLAGVLLLFPRTTILGAAIALGALIQVASLNMFYDVGLKLVSLHMIALAAVLLAPDVSRLADFFVRHRPAAASIPPLPGRTPRGRRAAVIAPLLFGAYLVGMYAYINWSFWQVAGGGRPRSALYGIWSVEQLSVDGVVRAPELNDYDRRWRRVIFDTPDALLVQRTDDSLAAYGATLDVERNVLALRKGNSRNWGATFTVDRLGQDRLELRGEMDGQRLEARLRRVEFDAFPLLNSRFRWIRPHER